jgi:hypothetical protein
VTEAASFYAFHDQGMLRVAAATPPGSVGDVDANAAGILCLWQHKRMPKVSILLSSQAVAVFLCDR